MLYGHHFAAIAGAGPLVGPVLAAQMGYLPGTIWIIVGVILAGAVQDYLVLFFSMRRGGRTIGQMARDELGKIGGTAAILASLLIMLIIVAILALVVVNALGESPWGVFSVSMTIPIALFMGLYLRYIRPAASPRSRSSASSAAHRRDRRRRLGRLDRVGLRGLPPRPHGDRLGHHRLRLRRRRAAVWLLLAPRDYLSTFMKVGVIVMLAGAIVLVRPEISVPAFSEFAGGQTGPVFSGPIFPFLFVTIACGALSGFHALIASGTTPKLVEKERQTASSATAACSWSRSWRSWPSSPPCRSTAASTSR